MNEQDLKRLFEQIDAKPDESVKTRTVAAALSAYDDAQNIGARKDQGNGDIHRLSTKSNFSEDKPMYQASTTTATRRWLYSGFASAALLVVGVYTAILATQQTGFELPELEPTKSVQSSEVVKVERSVERAMDSLASSEQAARPERLSAPAQLALQPFEADALASGIDDREVSRDFQMQVDPSDHSIDALRPPTVGAEKDSGVTRKAQAAATARKREPLGEAYAAAAPASAAAAAAARAAAPSTINEVITSTDYRDMGRDRFETIETNPIRRVSDEPISTFSIDIDTSSYSFMRRELNRGVLPQKDAIRLEEMVNYFPYEYPVPDKREAPFSTDIAVIDAPWREGNKLVRIGIKGYELRNTRPQTNLVFLLDVSGSMNSPDKLPLVKQSMRMLLTSLQPVDTVAIAVYAGAAGTVLEPTPVRDKQAILNALDRLQAGGATAGAAGIKLAYQLAEANLADGGVNRIILATDGDFNIGIHNREELKGFVERKRQSGVFLSVLGFGQGNYNNALMQSLAQNGNGVATYIDTLGEAQKVLVTEATSTLFPIAADVKVQLEFNPATVSEYRLLGYETRILAEEDFNNDAVDAGDIGAGHSVTALYEITPRDSNSGAFSDSRYSEPKPTEGSLDEYGYLKLRYKLPGEEVSRLISQPIPVQTDDAAIALQEARFAIAVAGFAELLRGGKYTGDWGYQDALQLALDNRGEDPFGYRSELVQLIRKAQVADAM
ncbi:MAG: VWA domain-containing protein [Pseudomonadota bacterium]